MCDLIRIKFDFAGDNSMVLTAVGGIGSGGDSAVYQIQKSQDRRSEHEYVPYGFCAEGVLRGAREQTKRFAVQRNLRQATPQELCKDGKSEVKPTKDTFAAEAKSARL